MSLADFGDPVETDSYALCLYDESVGGEPTTRLELAIPPGTAWQAKPTGFAYTDKLGTAGGVTVVVLKAGVAGKAKVSLKGMGPHLTLPTLPLVLPVTVQLRSHGLCWGARYEVGGLKKSTSSEFIAKSSPSGAFLDDPSGFWTLGGDDALGPAQTRAWVERIALRGLTGTCYACAPELLGLPAREVGSEEHDSQSGR